MGKINRIAAITVFLAILLAEFGDGSQPSKRKPSAKGKRTSSRRSGGSGKSSPSPATPKAAPSAKTAPTPATKSPPAAQPVAPAAGDKATTLLRQMEGHWEPVMQGLRDTVDIHVNADGSFNMASHQMPYKFWNLRPEHRPKNIAEGRSGEVFAKVAFGMKDDETFFVNYTLSPTDDEADAFYDNTMELSLFERAGRHYLMLHSVRTHAIYQRNGEALNAKSPDDIGSEPTVADSYTGVKMDRPLEPKKSKYDRS